MDNQSNLNWKVNRYPKQKPGLLEASNWKGQITMQVQTQHTGNVKRTFKVKLLTPEGADKLTFILRNRNDPNQSQEISVAAYFEMQYKRR